MTIAESQAQSPQAQLHPAARKTTTVRISLPDELISHYEALATIHGTELEDELANHLTRTRSYTAANPYYFEDAEAHELRRLLGARVDTPRKALDMIRRFVTWKIGGWKFELSPRRVEAIHYYAQSLQQPPDKAAEFVLNSALGAFLKC